MAQPIPGVVLLLSLPAISAAQDVYSWQSLSQLGIGDKVRVSVTKGKSLTGPFQDWTAEQVTVAAVTAKKAEVRKVERFRRGGRGRGRRAGFGALIGFGGGFAFGIAAGGGCGHSFGPCLSRPALGAAVGALGAVIGAASGASMPRRNTDVIYLAR